MDGKNLIKITHAYYGFYSKTRTDNEKTSDWTTINSWMCSIQSTFPLFVLISKSVVLSMRKTPQGNTMI